MRLRFVMTAIAALAAASPAIAQMGSSANPMYTNCINCGGASAASPTTATGGSITTANSYQSVLAASTSRKGCLIQNTSANTELAWPADPGTADPTKVITIAAGGSLSCNSPGLVISDQISLTSPVAGSTFVVWAQ